MSNLTIVKQLPRPWKVGGKMASDIELREATVDDFIEAERDANPAISPNAFNAALAARTCVRAGDFTGPFAPAHFKSMGAKNWYVVRAAINEAEELGEAEPAAPNQTS